MRTEDNILDDNFYSDKPPPKKQNLPNSDVILIAGICSIINCFCYVFMGLVCGICTLLISISSVQLYRKNPDAYSDWPILQAGRVCAIIGISISFLQSLLFIGQLLFE